MINVKKSERIIVFIFCLVYLLFLVYFTIFSEGFGREVSSDYRYNFVPFKEIKRFINYRNLIGNRNVIINILGNIAAFVPLGIFVPIMFSNKYNYIKMAIICFDVSLCIEIIQLVSRVGCFDVDDLLLNTLGGFIGYLIYLLAMYFKCGKKEKS